VRACGVYDYYIQVFNRFGKEVYTSRSLLQGWDGRVNGKKANPGVYFYNIVIKDLNGEILDYQGSFTLLDD
jgi:gliding motility-associated-like protein